MTEIGPDRFKELFLTNARFIDLRAPVEFIEGAIPGAVNLPLMTDDERHQVGIMYKQSGQEAAIRLGHSLVGGDIRAKRIESWKQELKQHPETILYCFRGGLRSQTVQQWLRDEGIPRPVIKGGYKALRRYLIDTLQTLIEDTEFELVCGPTGSGKTDFLHHSGRPFIDLEALTNHRGSAFGQMPTPQPTQIDFENNLAVALLKLSQNPGPVLIENESRLIGRRILPETLVKKMSASPRRILEIPFEQRVENIFKDYIQNSSLGQNQDLQKFEDFRQSVKKISQKLGGARTKELLDDLDTCQADYESTKSLGKNRTWIAKILTWYYDPNYRH